MYRLVEVGSRFNSILAGGVSSLYVCVNEAEGSFFSFFLSPRFIYLFKTLKKFPCCCSIAVNASLSLQLSRLVVSFIFHWFHTWYMYPILKYTHTHTHTHTHQEQNPDLVLRWSVLRAVKSINFSKFKNKARSPPSSATDTTFCFDLAVA